MPATPRMLTDRPADTRAVLHGLAESLQLSGAIFLRARFTAPWALASPPAPLLAAAVHPGARRVVLLHVVLEGDFVVTMPDGTSAHLGPGDVAILPTAQAHVMRSLAEENLTPQPISELFPPQPWKRMPALHHGGGGAPTSIVCGYLHSEEAESSPLLTALPPLIPVRVRSAAFTRWLLTNVDYALDDSAERAPGADLLVRRLPELVFFDCLARHAAQGDAPDG